MIESRIKNQKVVSDCINAFYAENEINKYILFKFTKKLIGAMLHRVEDDDCYFIDMLEDIERIEEL